MSELTKEYFDKQLGLLNARIDELPTRGEFNSLEERIQELPSRVELKSVEAKVDEINAKLTKTDQRDVQDSNALARDLVKHDRRLTRIEKHLSLKPAS